MVNPYEYSALEGVEIMARNSANYPVEVGESANNRVEVRIEASNVGKPGRGMLIFRDI